MLPPKKATFMGRTFYLAEIEWSYLMHANSLTNLSSQHIQQQKSFITLLAINLLMANINWLFSSTKWNAHTHTQWTVFRFSRIYCVCITLSIPISIYRLSVSISLFCAVSHGSSIVASHLFCCFVSSHVRCTLDTLIKHRITMFVI